MVELWSGVMVEVLLGFGFGFVMNAVAIVIALFDDVAVDVLRVGVIISCAS